MTKEQLFEIAIEVVIFLIASYFIFYKAWLTALGSEVAKLSTIEQLTQLTENVKNDFSKQIEEYKSKLSEELTLKIEPIKSELAKGNITHQIQFGYLHQERAKVILELYKKLIELHSAMIDWTNFMHPVIEDGEKESQERTKRANIALHDFKNFYLLNKLFFSKMFCKYIDEVFKEYWDKGWDFGYRQEVIKSGRLTGEYFNDYAKDMSKISAELKASLPLKIEEIEEIFRKILKVEEE
ncbi:hypothetical protein Clim_2263 [Chlorobium limicola DSM 245]|uniref:Uncharacterized protein n=1 Tax=Chlorobium limicola (strain DSM 245 / NBRC 103803 / 6330) TaxID=290315 RepID=B3EHC4_CHLL2|nr:hypothetical protein [Chlorobium limicola]ACD91286.1 hypothetical protein Clim_2263 [Chlorobium limicola DSM 245]